MYIYIKNSRRCSRYSCVRPFNAVTTVYLQHLGWVLLLRIIVQSGYVRPDGVIHRWKLARVRRISSSKTGISVLLFCITATATVFIDCSILGTRRIEVVREVYPPRPVSQCSSVSLQLLLFIDCTSLDTLAML